MQYVHLGRTGLLVSRLCLGTMNFGPQTTEPDSYTIMDKALDLGFNFYDTANVYGWKKGEGVTEQIERETGHRMPETFVVQSQPRSKPWKRHFYFRQTPTKTQDCGAASCQPPVVPPPAAGVVSQERARLAVAADTRSVPDPRI